MKRTHRPGDVIRHPRRTRRRAPLDSFARGFGAAVALCLGSAGFVLGLYYGLGWLLP